MCCGAVSIPNGMEFYKTQERGFTLGAEFQFPTGWNSTDTRSCEPRYDDVSILNGMEFYGRRGEPIL